MTEELFTKWTDGKLSPSEEKQLKLLMEEDSDLEAELAAMGSLSKMIKGETMASVEPPYSDFFNSQLMRKVDLEIKSQHPAKKVERWWQSLRWAWAPAGALALVLSFFAGHRVSRPTGDEMTAQSGKERDLVMSLPTVYFAGEVLEADVISDSSGEVSAIVVNGLSAIRDDIDLVTVSSEDPLPSTYSSSEARRFQ